MFFCSTMLIETS